ncbi:phosphatase PAP2 family protein [Sporomusa acidovorans]|uniref:Phosphatidic acid phosphatase type 2/haloperoxidase domain-containing protein n=1 Tax=Sporomusa acidovorans (strain ATCC 49682 / DSM 3132 / Mol) TaxID=1123286 RepID=A0ABZ3IXD0_SPOA4|nr:phosphatase PAP2 family protein [Sporomusa acidovorans]OZC22331.1 PAP2 superfamily protein [Sporomusa acidovorans DSM 3132]SDE46015.1 Membrane-associated enzyme, PAP2 (acid phosphatase) superfamily [Sporomusa acidovorans]
MTFFRQYRAILVTLVLFILNLLIIQYTNFDLFVQDYAFNFQTGKWLLEDVHTHYGWLLYTGIKVLLTLFAITLIVLLALSYKASFAYLQRYRRPLACVIISMMFCPLIVSTGKQVTNVYCPYQIERYGGKMPYVKPLSPYPADFKQEKRGQGFPAGHAAGGFALFSLFFVSRQLRTRLLLGGTGLSVGIFMAVYQILRGQHYIGDTLVTVLGCLLFNLVLFRLLPAEQPVMTAGGKAAGYRG